MVDLLSYQRVTVVQPSYWPHDLVIKQTNPEIIDRVAVEKPGAFQSFLTSAFTTTAGVRPAD